MILVNGAIKTGSHLLLDIVREFQFFGTIHGHFPYDRRDEVADCDKIIHIIRNPINQYISRARMLQIEPTDQVKLDAVVKDIVQCNNDMKEWFDDENVLIVKYEDLIDNHEETLQSISDYLEIPVPEGLAPPYKNTVMYSGSPSNYKDSPYWDINKKFPDMLGYDDEQERKDTQ